MQDVEYFRMSREARKINPKKPPLFGYPLVMFSDEVEIIEEPDPMLIYESEQARQDRRMK